MGNRMANILSISSQVVRGTVGNSAAAFAMQRLGHTVWQIPTVLYSNHPGHGRFSGKATTAEDIDALWQVIVAHGWQTQIDAVLTGYLPNRAVGERVAAIVGGLQTGNRALIYLCDPAIGDTPKGLYVPEDAARVIREVLLPLADITTPNTFELSWLTGTKLATGPDDAFSAMKILSVSSVITTSIPSPSGGTICNALTDGTQNHLCSTYRMDAAPNGTGDFFAAVYLASYLNGRASAEALGIATASVRIALEGSNGRDELNLIETQDAWAGVSVDAVESVPA